MVHHGGVSPTLVLDESIPRGRGHLTAWQHEADSPDVASEGASSGAVGFPAGADWLVGEVNLFAVPRTPLVRLDIHRLTIHDALGETLGSVTLTLDEQARPHHVLAIAVETPRHGIGRKTIEQLRRGAPQGLVIAQMMLQSVPFWQRIGVVLDPNSPRWELGRGFLPAPHRQTPELPWLVVRKEQLWSTRYVEQLRAQNGNPTRPISRGPIVASRHRST